MLHALWLTEITIRQGHGVLRDPATADRCQRYPWNEYTVRANYSKSTSRSRRIDSAGTVRPARFDDLARALFSSAVAVEKQPAAP
jgi:hypothetical protein